MPPLGDSFSKSARYTQSDEDLALPLHNLPARSNRETNHGRSSSVDTHKNRVDIHKSQAAPLLEEAGEGSDWDSEDSDMGRTKGSKAKEDSDHNGHANGHSEGMSSNVELRRKNVSFEPSIQTRHAESEQFLTLDDEPPPTPVHGGSDTSFFDLPRQDRRNFLLLVLLYFLQGIPMGLAGGSVPFLLKPYLSYGQIGVFSLASYPYSLKLLWSPIVDAIWSRRLGRRKSWIMPIQFCSGFAMIYLGSRATQMMKDAAAPDGSGIWTFTYWWFSLVFLCATQDIAVDGWALTLLSPANISYASTAQTVGLTAGHFLSFTVFLALNAPDFADKWFRKIPTHEGVISLGGYLTFWGWCYLLVTVGLAVLKREERTKERDSISEVYHSMWGVLNLKNIQTIVIIHLIAKIGFQANDAVTNLKLLEKHFSQEDMALTVLIDFPFELSLGYVAGRWSAIYPALDVWAWAFIGRIVAALFAQGVVMIFPPQGTTFWYLCTVIVSHIFSTFTSTVMFVAISAFHAKIADPEIGGTYMTLLATVSNLGGTFPRFFILKLVDYFTTATCYPNDGKEPFAAPGAAVITSPMSCALESDKKLCAAGGGTCITERDGYYYTNILCVLFGIVTFFMYIRPATKQIQALPLRAWRVNPTSRK